MSEHPTRWVAIRYRSKRRTLNLALALRGKSSGWGEAHGSDKPSRWFVGHCRAWSYHRGFEVEVVDPRSWRPRTVLAYEWAASPQPLAAH